jgi:hypothetical protein
MDMKKTICFEWGFLIWKQVGEKCREAESSSVGAK